MNQKTENRRLNFIESRVYKIMYNTLFNIPKFLKKSEQKLLLDKNPRNEE